MPLVIGFAVIIFIIFQSNVFELFSVIKRTDLRFFSCAVMSYIIINLVQAYRLKVILQGQGYGSISILKVFWIHMAGILISDATPGKSGYLSIAYFLKEDKNIRLSHGLHSVTYIYSVDFFIKALATSLAIVYLSLTLSIGIETVRAMLIVVAFGLFIAVLLFLVLYGVRPQQIESFLGRWTFGKRLLNMLQIFRESTLNTRSVLFLIIVLSLCSWFLWGICFYALGLSLGLPLPFLTFLFMQPLASLLTLVPITIGGLGFMEAGLTGIIILYGVSFERALAFALLTRVIEIIVNLSAGAKILFLRRKYLYSELPPNK